MRFLVPIRSMKFLLINKFFYTAKKAFPPGRTRKKSFNFSTLYLIFTIKKKETRKRASNFTGTFSRLLRVNAPYRDEQ